MKKIGLILSFYLILLAAIPCCAVDSCPDDKMEQTAAHEKGDEDCGSCSPFFSCEGCATVSTIYYPVLFELPKLQEEVAYSAYIQSALPWVDYDFWQPPRLS